MKRLLCPHAVSPLLAALPPGLDARLRARAERAASWILEQREAKRAVTVVHHIDADGVTSGAIAAQALRRAGCPYLLQPVKSLDAFHLKIIADAQPGALWFCDLGSTAYMHFPATPRLVCDHHELVRDGSEESFPHVNPLLDDLSGQSISGAGAAYLVAAALDAKNTDLLPLALVGATGDRQDRHDGGFDGTNALLVEHGIQLGLLEQRHDISWFGTETRSLRKFLQLSREPGIPTVTNDPRAAERLCMRLGIPIENDGKERTWSSLNETERTALRGALVDILLDCGLAERVPSLFRRVVNIAKERPGRPVRELQEYSTLLNGTARYDRPDVGILVCLGDRNTAYQEALDLLVDHRKHLVGALDAMARHGIQQLAAIQHVHLRDQVRDTVVGIVCGMALGAGGLEVARDKVLVGLAWTPDGRTKASARSPHELHARGIDLATAMRDAAASVGGQGGGHKGAAGATVPRDAELVFLTRLDAIVAAQIGMRPLAARPMPTPVLVAAEVPATAADQAWLPSTTRAGQQRLL